MKAKLEEISMQHRGVVLTSETEEEKKILQELWCGKGRPSMYGKLPDGNIEIVVAPTSDEADDD